MKEKLLVLVCFFLFTPALILTEFILLEKVSALAASKRDGDAIASILVSAEENYPPAGPVFSSADPLKETQIKGDVLAADARPLLIENYLNRYNSPLAPFSELIYTVSQEYGLDYRLIVAIAQQESNLCKKSPVNCFNCWGVGIHSRGTMCFGSYPQAIEWMANYLREEYFDKGLTTIEAMMKKYCPLSNGSWAFGVRQFMNELN